MALGFRAEFPRCFHARSDDHLIRNGPFNHVYIRAVPFARSFDCGVLRDSS